MSGQPHRNFAVKKFPGTGAMCAANWRPKIYWNKSHGCSSLQSSAQGLRRSWPWKRPSAPSGRAKPLRVDAELGPQGQADHVDPTRKLTLSARGVRQSQEIFGPQKLRCGWPDIGRNHAGGGLGYDHFLIAYWLKRFDEGGLALPRRLGLAARARLAALDQGMGAQAGREPTS